MKKITLKEVNEILAGLEKLGLLRPIGRRNGRPVWRLVRPDDFRCPACGGDWAGIQIPLWEVASALGHRDIRMTSRYAHLAPEHLRAAMATLERGR